MDGPLGQPSWKWQIGKYLQMKNFIDKNGYFKAIESIITKSEWQVLQVIRMN